MGIKQSTKFFTIFGLSLCFFWGSLEAMFKLTTRRYLISGSFFVPNVKFDIDVISENELLFKCFVSYWWISFAAFTMFAVFALFWWLRTIKNKEEFNELPKQYIVQWWLFFIMTWVVQVFLLWFQFHDIVAPKDANLYIWVFIVLFSVNLGAFLFLPKSYFFPARFRNLHFFKKATNNRRFA